MLIPSVVFPETVTFPKMVTVPGKASRKQSPMFLNPGS